MEKVKILKIYISDKKKDGTPFLTKDKKPFRKIAIKAEGGDVPTDVWISKLSFNQNDPALSLKEGDEVSIKIWQSEEGGYWNFDFPRQEDEMKDRLENLESLVDDLRNEVQELKEGRGMNIGAAIREMKKDDVKGESLPF